MVLNPPGGDAYRGLLDIASVEMTGHTKPPPETISIWALVSDTGPAKALEAIRQVATADKANFIFILNTFIVDH